MTTKTLNRIRDRYFDKLDEGTKSVYCRITDAKIVYMEAVTEIMGDIIDSRSNPLRKLMFWKYFR